MKNSSCCLTSLGIVCALGSGEQDILAQLRSEKPIAHRKRSGFVPQREVYLAEVSTELPEVPEKLSTVASRNVSLALAAFSQIERDVRECIENFGAERVGIIMGSSTSGISEGERAVTVHMQTGQLPDNFSYAKQEMGTVASSLAEYCGAKGPNYTISTACSSSAKVFRSARDLLETDICDAVVVGGIDSICRMTLNGFASLGLVAENISNPLSASRAGITIGEGAALFLMTREQGGVQFLGFGDSSDAYHISSPHPEGRGAASAITKALADAQCQPSEINYLNLHGTGTPANDAMECTALARVFSESEQLPLCSSTKPLTGHTLGASGAIEAGFCWLACQSIETTDGKRSWILPIHHFDGDYDPTLPTLPLVTRAKNTLNTTNAICLSNSFGFGGNNCSLIFGTTE